jgi:hypothetical protein
VNNQALCNKKTKSLMHIKILNEGYLKAMTVIQPLITGNIWFSGCQFDKMNGLF